MKKFPEDLFEETIHRVPLPASISQPCLVFIRGVVGWERVSTHFCTSNVTWRFRLHKNTAAISQIS